MRNKLLMVLMMVAFGLVGCSKEDDEDSLDIVEQQTMAMAPTYADGVATIPDSSPEVTQVIVEEEEGVVADDSSTTPEEQIEMVAVKAKAAAKDSAANASAAVTNNAQSALPSMQEQAPVQAPPMPQVLQQQIPTATPAQFPSSQQ